MRSHGGALPARHILGNYELFEEIGRGGMGVVYRALDLSLDRIVAVKILHDDLRAQPQIVSRFNREAKAAACLDHPNIVQIYAVGNVEGTPFIAMEYVDAAPLSALMQRESNLHWAQALDIAGQVSAALACAHDAHVIHRDIKPPNILITDQGKAYVTDFGIAKILTADDHLTLDGSRLGTPHYMSPERCKNGNLTGASDLYSLGVLLFQMLSGRLPYEAASSVELIRKIVSEPPFRLRLFCPDLPEEVERLIAWTIEKQPRHRPADGRILFEAIQRVRHGGTVDTSAGPMLSVLSDYRQAVQRSLAPPQRLASGLTPITETLPPSWRKKCRQAFFAALCTVPILLAGLYYGIRGEGAPDPASLTAQNDPALWFVEDQVAGFQEEAPGITLARINLPGYEISRAGWTGARGTLVAQLDNTSHAHHEGWRTVCAVMPETRQSSIVVPPGLCTPNAKGTPQIAALAFSHDNSPDTALTGRWLAEVESTQPDGAAPVWALALFPTDGTSTAAPLLSLPSGARASTAAMHPDGTRVAAALMGKGAVGRVVEWTLPDTAAPVDERVLESTGAPVHSLCYSPKGERLAILREDSRGNRMLSIVPGSGTVDVHPPVLHGALALGSRPFSADGRLLAVSEAREEGPARILLLSADDGQIQAELGEGECASWHPTRNALLVVAPDRKSVSQLWELETTPPYRRIQVTHLEHGVRPPCDVSQDGRWGIALSDAAGAPALVFVQLQTASFRLQ